MNFVAFIEFYNIFNKTFIENEQFKTQIEPTPDPEIPLDRLTAFRFIILKDLVSIYNSLKLKNTSGVDGISNKLLMQCKDETMHPLLNIINCSIHCFEVPIKIKTAVVYPIFKKGDKALPENYRPISVQPIII